MMKRIIRLYGQGSGIKKNTWQPVKNLNYPAKLKSFHQRHPKLR